MKWISKLLNNSEFAKNVLTLSIGAALAQAITLFVTMILARVYLPVHFGTLSIFLSIVNIILVFATGKYELAIVLARNSTSAFRIGQLSLLIAFALSCLTLLVLTFSDILGLQLHKNQEVQSCLIFMPLSIFLLAGIQVFSMQNIRDKSFKILAVTRVIEALTMGVIAYVLIFLGNKGLIYATLLSQLVSFGVLAYFYYRNSSESITSWPATELKSNAKEYSIFPKTNILQSFVEMFQLSAIVLIGSYYFKTEVLGYYALCMRVLQAPMGLIIKPIANVFLGEASRLYLENGDLYRLTKKTIQRTLFFLSPVILIIALFGPYLFTKIFGSQWYEAGRYAQLFLPWIIADLVRSPISQLAYVTGQQKMVLLYTIASGLILLGSIVCAGLYFNNIYYSFGFISALQAISATILIFVFLRIAKTAKSIDSNPSIS